MTTTPPTPTVSGSFSAVGVGASFGLPEGQTGVAPLYATISGTFVGTVQLQRSFDGGETWVPAGTATSAPSFTAPGSVGFVGVTPAGVI